MGGGFDLGGGHIFSGEVDVGCVGPMFVAMIVFCWFLDLFFSTIEEKVEESPANSLMVYKVYKELMILGLIQFIFILLKDFGIVHPTKSYTGCFDFCLLMVTYTVFLYVFNTLVSSFGMHVSKRSWDRMAMQTTHDVIRDLKHMLPPDKPTCAQAVGLWLDDFVKNTLGIGKHWRAEADFKVVELLFKTKFYLDRTFDYNKYLELVLEDVVVNLSQLSPYHWFAVMILCKMAEKTSDAAEIKAEKARMATEERLLLAMQQAGMQDGSSAADDNSGIRRRLGAASGEESESDCAFFSDTGPPVVPMPCGMDLATIQSTTAQLFTTAQVNVTDFESTVAGGWSLNVTNTTSSYDFFCRKCEIEQKLQEQNPLSSTSIVVFILGGWLLFIIEVVVLHFLRHRHNLIYHYHGASHPSNMPILLSKLDKHFERNQDRGKRRVDGHLVAEETITVHHDGNETDSDNDDDDDAPSSQLGINPATSPDSLRNLRTFLDNDITNSPTDERKRQLQKEKEKEKKKEQKAEEQGQTTDEQTERKGEEMEMMHFSNAQKDANDVLSYRLYVFLCSVTKMVMLLCCLYISFYWWHYSLRVNQTLMRTTHLRLGLRGTDYGLREGEEVELTPWGTDASADRCLFVAPCFADALFYHFMALLPPLMLIFMVLPRVTRRISLLVGVLHLHEDALQVTVEHMETIENVRKRIVTRLETTTVVKGEPKLQLGKDMLDRLRTGEVALLHKLASIDEKQHQKNIEMSHKKSDEHRELWSGVDWSSPPPEALAAVKTIQRSYLKSVFVRRLATHTLGSVVTAKRLGLSRVTRKQAMELLDQQETQTQTAELVKFLSREAFVEFQEKSPACKETALSAKSLRLSPNNPDDDTILVSEFGTFLVRAAADVANVAGECGVSWEDIKTFEDEVVNLGIITRSQFVTARRMARSKALFYNMSRKGETVNYKQLRKGLKRYRVPVSKEELDIICRIIDPDQTQSISLEEWLDFILVSDDNLAQQVLRSTMMARKANAMKGSQQEGLFGMALDTWQYSREVISAVPMGAMVLTTIEHPVESGKRAVRGVQTLAEMEANDALAVVAGIDKQRRKIVHEFQPMVEGAFVDVASLGLHAVEAGVGGVVHAVESGVDRAIEEVGHIYRSPQSSPSQTNVSFEREHRR